MPIRLKSYGEKARLSLSGNITVDEVPEIVDYIIFNMNKKMTIDLNNVERLSPDVALVIGAAKKTISSYGCKLLVNDPNLRLENAEVTSEADTNLLDGVA
ncbi:MAG: hypothetical protein KAT46_02225 [Deltaproteobacteria bacterium]|nr:hypothetical protein [Deltaproteobacteria bacterium]